MGWISGWKRRKKHTITGTVAGLQANYVTIIKVYKGAGADGTETLDGIIYGKVYCGGNCEDDFDDVRFTTDDGSTELSYYLEDKSDTNWALFYVNIPSIPVSPGTVDIYVYYDKPAASSDSDGFGTFPFYDDFASFDADKHAGNPLFTFADLAEPSVIKDGTAYWMYYNETVGGPVHTIYRRISNDGGFTFGAKTNVLNNALYPSVWKDGATYRMVYCNPALTEIRLATSATGVAFIDQGLLVPLGPGGSFDDAVLADPYELKIGSTYYLFYTAKDGAEFSMGLTTSATGGVGTFVKQGQVLAKFGTGWESVGVFDSSVLEYDADKFVMFYTGFDGAKQMCGYATADVADLTTWTRNADNPVYWKTSSWEKDGTYGPNEPDVMLEDSTFKIWYRGNTEGTLEGIGRLDMAQDPVTLLPVQNYPLIWDWTNNIQTSYQIESDVLNINDVVGDHKYFYSKDITALADSIIRTKVKYVTNENCGPAGRIDPTTEDEYSVGGAGTVTDQYLFEHVAGAFNSLGNVAFVHGAGWNRFKLWMNGTTIKSKEWHEGNVEPNWDLSGVDASHANGNVGLYASDGEYDIDDIWMREYANPEPTHTSWDAEESFVGLAAQKILAWV